MHVQPRKITLSALFLVFLSLGTVLWAPNATIAQSGTTACSQLLSKVEQHLSAGCQSMQQDEVCYGNRQISVEYADANGQSTFQKEGDIARLNTIKSLKAGPLNPDNGEWGVAVIKAQTTALEGTTSGQVVTFIVYGDTTISGQVAPIGNEGQPTAPTSCHATPIRATYLRASPGPNDPQVVLLQPGVSATITGRTVDGQWVYAESQGQKGWLYTKVLNVDCDPSVLPVADSAVKTLPGVNAFYFTTGIQAQSSCRDIPPAGLFVQSPKGMSVSFKLNGADIVMGSTGVFTFRPGASNTITIWTMDGEIDVIVGGTWFRVPAGNARDFPLGGSDGMQLIRRPTDLRPISLADPQAPIYIRTLCAVAKAAGLTVQGCTIKPPPTPVSNTSGPTQVACQPTQPGLPCNCNGVCDPNGESYYTCPQDCPFAPIPPAAATAVCLQAGSGCKPAGIPSCCAGSICKPLPISTALIYTCQ
jgi:hypothetical protein